MSKYTTELRFICETTAGLTDSEGYTSTREIIEKSRAKIFDFDYPIFDEKYRSVLETKIIKHYYTREIAGETVGLWKLWLDERMNNIMPYYNQLYKSELLEFNPLYDTDITTDSNRNETHEENTTDSNVRTDNTNREETGTQTRTDDLASKNTRTDNLTSANSHEDHDNDSDTNDSLTAYSDTPQNGLAGVNELNYLTNATKVNGNDSKTHDNNGTSTTKNTGTQVDDATQTGTVKNDITNTVKNTGTVSDSGTGTKNYDNVNDYLEHVKGKRGTDSYAKLLSEYRKTFLNIDQMIINNLSDLFMGVW